MVNWRQRLDSLDLLEAALATQMQVKIRREGSLGYVEDLLGPKQNHRRLERLTLPVITASQAFASRPPNQVTTLPAQVCTSRTQYRR